MDNILTNVFINYIQNKINSNVISVGNTKITLNKYSKYNDNLYYSTTIKKLIPNNNDNIINILLNDKDNIHNLIKENIDKFYSTQNPNIVVEYNKINDDELSININIIFDLNKFNTKLYFELMSKLYVGYKQAGIEYDTIMLNNQKNSITLTNDEQISLEISLNLKYVPASTCPNLIDNMFIDIKQLGIPKLYYSYLSLYEEIFIKNRIIYPEDLIETNLCKLFYINYPNMLWIKARLEYTINLDKSLLDLLVFYTYKGDEIISDFINGGYNMNEDIKKLFIEALDDIMERAKNEDMFKINILNVNISTKINDIGNYLNDIINKIQDIIYKSPVSNQSFRVFRGLKNTLNNNINDTILFTKFTSTTLYIVKAIDFAKLYNLDGGTLLGIIIPENFNCLLLEGISPFAENEILLPVGTKLRITNVINDYEITYFNWKYNKGDADKTLYEYYKNNIVKIKLIQCEILL
jgi:hypothetical protein